MYDFIELRIPFSADYLAQNAFFDGRLVLDIKQVCKPDQIKLQAGAVYFDGIKTEVEELRHPYESLKSSHSGLAFKIFQCGFGNYDMPHILLKGSPAKILQGHNVYGSSDFKVGFFEFMAILASTYPFLYSCLDHKKAEIRALDCTFFARAESEFLSKQVIKMLTRVNNRHVRASREQFETTVYQNRKSSYYVLKTYLKQFEVEREIKELSTTIKKTFDEPSLKKLNNKLSILNEAYKFSKNMIRFEGRLKARKMEDLNIPTNAFKFIEYSKDKPELLKNMWSVMFEPLLETLKGQTMDTMNDDEIINKIKLTFDSKRKQTKLINFFLLVKSQGYTRAKDLMDRATFWRNEKELLSVGLSKINLQNLENETTNIIPLLKVINIDFTNQVPHGYKEPVSQFETKLRLVS